MGMSERKHLYKAICKANKRWFEGYYVRQEDISYCFKDDADKNPDNVKHYIVFDRSIDWGLPNEHLKAEVYGDTICEVADGLKTTDGRLLYEHDIVKISTSQYVFHRYEILWNDHELCWCGERIGKKENDGFDRIRLNSDWKYEYHGNTCEKEGE